MEPRRLSVESYFSAAVCAEILFGIIIAANLYIGELALQNKEIIGFGPIIVAFIAAYKAVEAAKYTGNIISNRPIS